jgi:hypothetical protein
MRVATQRLLDEDHRLRAGDHRVGQDRGIQANRLDRIAVDGFRHADAHMAG